jgi:large subunit ribosomal protein L21
MTTQYAIIKTGGKQYRVQAGDIIDVELQEAKEDGSVEFKDVLLLHDGKEMRLGGPTIENSLVRGELIDEVRGPKIIAYKYKKRKNYRRKVGHRQNYLRVRITDLGL